MFDPFAKKVKQSRRIKSLPSDWIVPKEEWDSYYQHFTLRVRTLPEYIEVINRLAKINDSPMYRLVYRGHSDASSKYRLVPTIGRKRSIMDLTENRMVTEMLSLRPEEFAGIRTNFDLLSKLQHFGLPTRLLDFTYNPLIALYFACCTETNADSRIICTQDTSDTSTADVVEKICGMYQYNDYHAISLDQVIGGVSQLRKYSIYTREPLMAIPKYSNDRIKHQSAVFMVFPNAVYDLRSQMVIEGRKTGDEHQYKRFIITPEEEKRLEYVRKEPDIYHGAYYVDSRTLRDLFHYYEKQYDDFAQPSLDIAGKYHFLFQNRFSIVNEIQELPDYTLSSSFISILIESKNKKRMIEDLATIGINKAFVFPELEYTTESIKNRLF